MHPVKRRSDQGTELAQAAANSSQERHSLSFNDTTTSARPPLRSKKSSHLAFFKIFNKLRSPDNSDEDEDGNGDDLDFGCSGLHSLLEVEQDASSLDGFNELHISIDPHTHSPGDGHTSLELPSRSASIAGSMNSSISSINLSTSDCTFSTPTTSFSQAPSARSSFSSLTSPTSPNINNKKCVITQTSPPSKASTIQSTSVSHIQSHAIQEVEETEEETEEQAILCRKQEEEAAIEALEAYFASRRASDAIKPLSSATENVRPPPTEVTTMSRDTFETYSQGKVYGRRCSSPTLLPYASPYFETYANDPLPPLSLKNYNDTSFSSSKADCTLPSSPVQAASESNRPTENVSISPSHLSSKQAIIFPRPPLRTRRSEASLRDPIHPQNGTSRRRPSLAPSMTCLNTRPRGLTFSNSSPSLIRLGIEIRQTSNLASIPCTPTTIHPSSLKSVATTPTAPMTQIASSREETPTSSNFLDLDLSPESPNYKIGQVIPSPPRSSSLAPASGWPKHSLPSFTSATTTNTRCQPFVARESNVLIPSPTSFDFGLEEEEDFHGSLEAYRFPARNMSDSSTPAMSRSTSVKSLYNTTKMEAGTGLPPTSKVHSPLGSATASRRGSLVASPLLTLRSRAGSVAASGGGSLYRNAVYEYI